MTKPRRPRSLSRVMLYIFAGGTLTAALVLLLAPFGLFHSAYLPWPLLVVMAVFRLFLPIGAVLYLHLCLPIPKGSESRLVRATVGAGLCIAMAGILWMSQGDPDPLGPGWRDLPWVALLVMNESARYGMYRRSANLAVLAFFGLCFAIGLTLVLGTAIAHVNTRYDDFWGMLASLRAFVAPRPWVAMLWLAGLWTWVASAERAPDKVENSAPPEELCTK